MFSMLNVKEPVGVHKTFFIYFAAQINFILDAGIY